MTDLLLAFITGLTTGGLSCLAVQGGLLASSMAHQLEQDLAPGGSKDSPRKVNAAGPILWFLASKLIAYTILGYLLGALGSVLQLTPIMRAVLQIGIGVFMLGQALRLLNVHPFFRRFNIEPPAFIRRFIRQKAKGTDSIATPVFLGALTVLIPCGITQVMMASAISGGDPARGAALMFAFILGTSPVFFVVAYFATRLGARLEKYFMKAVAVVVMVLAFLAINTGLNLMGSPLSVNRLLSGFNQPAAVQAASITGLGGESLDGNSTNLLGKTFGAQEASGTPKSGCGCGMLTGTGTPEAPAPATVVEPAAPATTESNSVTVNVLNGGYSPDLLKVKAGQPIQLTLVSNDTRSCSLAFVIPSLNIQFLMDPTETKTIELPAMQSGDQLPFSCSMGMYTGVIVAE